MLVKFNDNIQYSFIGNDICTIYAKPNHTLNDILMCKRYIRDKNRYVMFRDTVNVKDKR